MEKQLEKIFKDENQYMKYKLIIKNIAHTLLMYNENLKLIQEDNEKLIVLNNNKINNKNNEFNFFNIQIEKLKILFLKRNNSILVATFPKSSSTQFQRLLLIHIFIALINFKGDSISVMKKLNDYEQYNKDSYINLKTLYNENINLPTREINDLLELLIFEYYFLKIIIIHFSKVFNSIFKKEYLNLNQTRFKNLYIIDLGNSSIILDMREVQGEKGNKQKKYIKNKKLLEEILYHSKHMYETYIRENGMKFTTADSLFRFVKFECTSTFPRLLFIIKFIPVLKGIAVIHLYYQKKLSRSIENNPLEQELRYKEIDLLFGSYIRDNQNLEFKYGAPKKLQHIEKFFEEFFISNRNGFDIFYINNNSKKLKYVNYSIINIINKVPVSNNVNIEQLFTNINKKIEEDYIREENIKKEKEIFRKNNINEDTESNIDNSDEKNNNDSEENSTDNIFLLNKDNVFKEILNIEKYNINTNNNKNKKQISLIFNASFNKNSFLDENKKDNEYKNKSYRKIIKKIGSNINIEEPHENSERKNLLRREISFNNKSKFSKFDNFSMISEIKTKERFEIKASNSSKNNIKEDIKENSINNSSNENDIKLFEILDFTNTNKNSNKNNNENDNYIIQKEYIEDELNIKNTDSKNLISKSENDSNN